MASGSDRVGVNWEAYSRIRRDMENRKRNFRNKKSEQKKKKFDEAITEKQLAYIKDIEKKIGIPFEGSTKKDAFDYITKHKAQFYGDS